MSVKQLLLGATHSSGHVIDNSVYGDGTSGYFSRTPAGAGDRKTWTLSIWVKRTILGAEQYIFSAGAAATDYTAVRFTAGDTLEVIRVVASATDANKITTALYRDVGAFIHIVVKMDAANTNLDLYVNGSEVTAFGTSNEPSNIDGAENNTVAHTVGARSYTVTSYFPGYMADAYLIDGQALTPSSFGETDATTGSWKPKAYGGTYGTNGFHLDFADSGDLGNDVSGNGNDFTKNGTVTQTTDSPTDDAAADVGNFCTFNPIDNLTTGVTLTNGNLTCQWVSPNQRGMLGTMAASTGKFYWEYVMTAGSVAQMVGVVPIDRVTRNAAYDVQAAGNQGVFYYWYNGNKRVNGTYSAYGASVATGQVVGIALDLDAQDVEFFKLNVSQGSIVLPVADKEWAPAFGEGGDYNTNKANFGQTAFTYTPPSGFLPLCTANLAAPTIVDPSPHFTSVIYTGTGASNAITGVGFQPDLVWIKGRSGATDHAIYDAVRGVENQLESNTVAAESTESTGLTAFGADGFTVGALAQVNTASATYVAWCWKMNGAGSANTDGTISSTVSANTTAGMSIVQYAGSGANATVGHGLGAVPEMIITMVQNNTGGDPHHVQHVSLGPTKRLKLNATTAAETNSAYWNDTAPSSSVFSVGTAAGTNGSGYNIVAYCFAEVSGMSKFDTYTGNGSASGPFVWCGFRPKYVMIKRTNSTSDWYIWDIARNAYNVVDKTLLANTAGAETTSTSLDINSNGFKCRSATIVNASGGTYIFAAFSEFPFGGEATTQGKAR